MPTVKKAVKERDCTQMPVTKKERTDHKYLWQRKNIPQMLVAKKERPNHKCW